MSHFAFSLVCYQGQTLSVVDLTKSTLSSFAGKELFWFLLSCGHISRDVSVLRSDEFDTFKSSADVVVVGFFDAP